MPAGHTAIPHPAALDRERVGEVQSRAQREKRSYMVTETQDLILCTSQVPPSRDLGSVTCP